MSSSRRYTPSSSRPGGRDKSKRVTDLRSKRDEDDAPHVQHSRIVEDSIVDSCVDHAHAVARVHGAQEVMLEHLIHALARVTEAAEILEEQGYDVDTIRRESAAIIASDIPVGKHDSKRELYASNDFNTVMHLAAANASRQGEMEISVWELLEAISGYDVDVSAVRLLSEGRRDNRSRPRGGDGQGGGYRGRADRGNMQADLSGRREYFAEFNGRSAGSSDELLQQGLAAIETALSRQNEGRNVVDPEFDEKFDRLENRMSGLVDHRDREIKELKELITSLNNRDEEGAQTKAVHADILALREAVDKRGGSEGAVAMRAELAELRAALDKRDEELREWTVHIAQRVDGVKDDMGTILSDPQTGLLNEIRALSERIDGGGNEDVAKLSTNMRSDFANMVTRFDTRQGEIVGLHSTLGKGVDEQGSRLRGLEARLREEHDQTQGELRAMRGFLEKIAGSVDNYRGEIERLRLDHIGDMSVVSNKLDDISEGVKGVGSRSKVDGRSIGKASPHGAGWGHNPRPTKNEIRPKRSSVKLAGPVVFNSGYGQGPGANSDDMFNYRDPTDKKLVIDAETTQHVARRFAKSTSGGDADSTDSTNSRDRKRGPRGSMDYAQGKVSIEDDKLMYRGQKIRRTRSSTQQTGSGTTLRERLVYRGVKLKDKLTANRAEGVKTSREADVVETSWGQRFWKDVKGLFRDDDPRWTDWRK